MPHSKVKRAVVEFFKTVASAEEEPAAACKAPKRAKKATKGKPVQLIVRRGLSIAPIKTGKGLVMSPSEPFKSLDNPKEYLTPSPTPVLSPEF